MILTAPLHYFMAPEILLHFTGAISLAGENNLTTLYIPASGAALDVKLSFTVSMWVKVHSSFPDLAQASLLSFAPLSQLGT